MRLQVSTDRVRGRRLEVAIAAAVAVWSILGLDVCGQHWGSMSAGRGSLSIDAPDVEQFIDTFNSSLRTELTSPLQSFGRATGWHFDVGYETVFGTVGSSVNSGLHRYSTTTGTRFVSGAAHEFEIMIQDLTGSWEILIYQRYLFFGPGLWVNRRRVNLQSRETVAGSPLADRGLTGEYSGSSYELRWGGIAGVWWGPFRASLRVLRPGRVLGGDGLLFDGDNDKLGTSATYFPRDYRAFAEDGVGGRANAARTDVRGRIVELAVAISFPL